MSLVFVAEEGGEDLREPDDHRKLHDVESANHRKEPEEGGEDQREPDDHRKLHDVESANHREQPEEGGEGPREPDDHRKLHDVESVSNREQPEEGGENLRKRVSKTAAGTSTPHQPPVDLTVALDQLHVSKRKARGPLGMQFFYSCMLPGFYLPFIVS